MNNLEYLTNKYDINNDDIVESLKKLIVKIHPDNFGGDFRDKNHEDDFHKIQELLELYEKIGNELIPVNLIYPKLLDKYKDAEEKSNSIKKKVQDNVKSSNSFIRKKYRNTRILSVSFTSILSFIYLLPSEIIDNSLFGNYIDTNSDNFFIVWMILLLFTMDFLIAIYFLEKSEQKTNNYFLNEENICNVFDSYCRDNYDNYNGLTKREFMYYIKRGEYTQIYHRRSELRVFLRIPNTSVLMLILLCILNIMLVVTLDSSMFIQSPLYFLIMFTTNIFIMLFIFLKNNLLIRINEELVNDIADYAFNKAMVKNIIQLQQSNRSLIDVYEFVK